MLIAGSDTPTERGRGQRAISRQGVISELEGLGCEAGRVSTLMLWPGEPKSPNRGQERDPGWGGGGSRSADGEVDDRDRVSSSGGKAQHLSEGRVAGRVSRRGRE